MNRPAQKRKRSQSPGTKIAVRAKEINNTLTQDLYSMNVLPANVQNAVRGQMLQLPLGLLRPGTRMPKVYPPGKPNAQPIEITERDSAYVGVQRQKEVAIGTGIDPAKGYFVVVFKAFEKPIEKMTEKYREELPAKVRQQLEEWEKDVVRAAAAGDPVAKFIEAYILSNIGWIMNGNHR